MKSAALTFICAANMLLCAAQEVSFKAVVYNKMNREPIPGATLSVQDLKSLREFKTTTNEAGTGSLMLNQQGHYRLEVSATNTPGGEDFLNFSYILTDRELSAKGPFVIELEKIKREESGLLTAIHFKYYEAALGSENEAVLGKLVQMLKAYPSMRVEIGVHADCREPDNLTTQRVKELTTFITGTGVSSQVVVKSFGNVRPLNQCGCLNQGFSCPEEKYTENRRAEFKIIAF